MKTCKILMPTGSLGAGINQESFKAGMAMKPDGIAVDGGSTDSGPTYLANGISKYPKKTLKYDLKTCILGALKAGIPLMIGSCSTCGTDSTVDLCAEIAQEILKEEGLNAKIAKIYAQQDPEVLKKKWDEGKIHALEGAPEITKETFDQCDNIVALMGSEPYIRAIEEGANIILGGRTTDTAVIAALPLMRGCNTAAAWHGAKTVECGSQCTDGAGGDGAFLEVDEKGFYVRPLQKDVHCTPYTVSAHLMYENADPFCLLEPSGAIMGKDAKYTQVDDQTVYVEGTKFEHAKQYTMKLEGARTVGYQNISLVGIANRKVMADPESWIKNISEYGQNLLNKSGFDPSSYSFNFKAYGYNAVVAGPVPEGTPTPREIGMLFTVTADTQDLATQVAKVFNPLLLHFPADFKEQLPSFAFPFSPVDCPRGQTCEFMLHHIVDTDDPMELVRLEYLNV